jgi:hypothetical protein
VSPLTFPDNFLISIPIIVRGKFLYNDSKEEEMTMTTDTMDMLVTVMKSPEMLYRTILSTLSSIRSEGGMVEVSISTIGSGGISA